MSQITLRELKLNSAVKYIAREGFVNEFPITFAYDNPSQLQVFVGFKRVGEWDLKVLNGLPSVVLPEDLKVGQGITIRRASPAEGVPHTYQYKGNAQGGAEFSAKTIDENFEYMSNLVSEVEDYNTIAQDNLSDMEEKFDVTQDIANEAIRVAKEAKDTAENAEDVALGIDGKAQEALDNSQSALDNSELALTTALGIDSKAQEALDKSTTASQDASDALSIALGVDGKAQEALDNSELALEDINNKRDLDDNVFNGLMTIKSDNDEQGAGILLQEFDGTVRGQVVVTDQGLQLTQYPEDGGLQTFTFPSEGGEIVLKQELAGEPTSGKGATLVRGSVVQISNIAELRTMEPAHDGQQCVLLGHSIAGVGGGTFYADYNSNMADDNGVTVVTAGGKRWVRKLDGYVTPDMFGAYGDDIRDDYVEIQKALHSGYTVVIPAKTYFSSQALDCGDVSIVGQDLYNSKIRSSSDDYILYTTYDKKFYINNLSIEGDMSKSSQIGLFQDLDDTGRWHSRSHRLGRVIINNCGMDGIYFSNGCEITNFENVFVNGCGRDGIHIDATQISDSPIEYLNFTRSKFHYNGRYNMYFKYIKKHVKISFCDLSSSGSIVGEPTPVTSINSMIPAIYVEDSPFGMGAGTTYNITIEDNFLENATILAKIKASKVYGGNGELLGVTFKRNTIYPKGWAYKGDGDIYAMCLFDLQYLGGIVSDSNFPRAGMHYAGSVSSYSSTIDTQNDSGMIVSPNLNFLKFIPFSPIIRGSGNAGTCTYLDQQGFYIRRGNRVDVEIVIKWSGHSGSSGSAQVAGLPFNIGGHSGSIRIPCHITGFSLGENRSYFLDLFSGTKLATLYYYDSLTGVASGHMVPSSGSIHASFSYFTE